MPGISTRIRNGTSSATRNQRKAANAHKSDPIDGPQPQRIGPSSTFVKSKIRNEIKGDWEKQRQRPLAVNQHSMLFWTAVPQTQASDLVPVLAICRSIRPEARWLSLNKNGLVRHAAKKHDTCCCDCAKQQISSSTFFLPFFHCYFFAIASAQLEGEVALFSPLCQSQKG